MAFPCVFRFLTKQTSTVKDFSLFLVRNLETQEKVIECWCLFIFFWIEFWRRGGFLLFGNTSNSDVKYCQNGVLKKCFKRLSGLYAVHSLNSCSPLVFKIQSKRHKKVFESWCLFNIFSMTFPYVFRFLSPET